MRWSTNLLVLSLVACSVLTAPMDSSPSAIYHFQFQRYQEFYERKLRYLGLLFQPTEFHHLPITVHLEVLGLHKYIASTHQEMRVKARQKSTTAALKRANALGEKIKAEILGPLHPHNIERQTEDSIMRLQAAYDNLLLAFNHGDNEFAKDQIFNHPENGLWADYASAFHDLSNAASPLLSIYHIVD